jgi:Ni/Co efflux regulator RcnB
MKTIVIALAAVTALASASPAAAQYGQYDRGGRFLSINERQDRLERRIEQGMRNGQLTRAEAYRLRREFQRIARLENRYRSNGLNGWERADLDRRFDALQAQIRFERRDGDRYGYNEYPRY